MVAVHAFAFAVCTLPTGFGNEYHKGDRVVVNKLVRDSFRRGDLVLYYPDWRVTSRYADSPMNIGRIEAIPGDTSCISIRSWERPTDSHRKAPCGSVPRLAFCVPRLAFCVPRLAFCVPRLAFCVPRLAFCCAASCLLCVTVGYAAVVQRPSACLAAAQFLPRRSLPAFIHPSSFITQH